MKPMCIEIWRSQFLYDFTPNLDSIFNLLQKYNVKNEDGQKTEN